jgi:tRNA dimethylallyltransferase
LDFEERSLLYERIDRRVSIMLELGLIDEIRQLLNSGISAKCTAMQAIGYKEFVSALAGYGTIEEAAELVRQSSRRYAKRQLTWFRREPNVTWVDRQNFKDNDEIVEYIYNKYVTEIQNGN